MDPEAIPKLTYAFEFLAEARTSGLIDEATYSRLREVLVARWYAAYAAESPVAAVAVSAPSRDLAAAAGAVVEAPRRPDEPVAVSAPAVRPGSTTWDRPAEAPPLPAPVRPKPQRPSIPSVWPQRLRRLRGAVAADLALHGLAYIGVVLTFAGTFGFVFFAFGSVSSPIRPVAEAVIPAVFFGSAWFLRRRDAAVVAVGLEILGGAFLPVVAFASLSDGAPIPPDPAGPPLAAALTVSCLTIAGGYEVWRRRHPGSPLRYLTGPLVWTSVLAIGFLLKQDEPLAGRAIERPVAIQLALVAIAVMATLAVLRRVRHPAAQPIRVAAGPALVLAYVLTVVLAAGEGWPTLPLVLTGAAVLAGTELVEGGVRSFAATPFAQAVLLAATVAPMVPAIGPGGAGLAATAGAVAIWERWRELDRAPGRMAAVAVGAAGLGMAWARPWSLIAAWTVASVWAHIGRVRAAPRAREHGLPLVALAAILPVGAAFGIDRAWPGGPGLAVVAGALAGGAVVVRLRTAGDAFWRWWIPASAAATDTGIWLSHQLLLPMRPGVLALAAGLSAVALAVPPGRAIIRVWSAAAGVTLAAWLALDAWQAGPAARPVAWSLLALAAVATALLLQSETGVHVAAAGHLAAVGTLAAPTSGAPRAIILSAWTLGWVTSAVAEELGVPSVAGLARLVPARMLTAVRKLLARLLGVVPAALASASAPLAVVRLLQLWPVFARHRAWGGVAVSLVALGESMLAGWASDRRRLASILAAWAVALSAVGIAVAAPRPWPVILTLFGAIGAVWLIGGRLRRPVMTWFAWTASGVLAILLANRAGIPFGQTNVTAFGWGAILLIGGLALDDRSAGRRSPGQGLRRTWLIPPVALGALAVPLSVAPAFLSGPGPAGGWCLAGAAVFAAAALQLRAGAVSGVSYAAGTLGVSLLLPWSALEHPWILVPEAGLLVAVGWAFGRRTEPGDPWLRWDLPPFVVAHLVATLALARSIEVDAVIPAWAGTGALALAVAAWRRRWPWEVAGYALALVAAVEAGDWWAAAVLGVMAGRGAWAASGAHGTLRSGLQGICAASAAAAWIEAMRATGWADPSVLSATAVAAGSVALLVGLGVRMRRLRLDWAMSLGGLALAGAATSLVATSVVTIHGVLPAAGTALTALGAGLAVDLERRQWPAVLAVAGTGFAWLQLLVGLGISLDRGLMATAITSGALALGSGGALRASRLPMPWARGWGALSIVALAVTGAATTAAWSAGTIAAAGPVGALAAGLGLLACAEALAAAPLALPWLREATSLTAVAAGLLVAAAHPRPAWRPAAGALVAGFAGTALSLALWRGRRSSPWLRPLAMFAALAAALAVPIAVSDPAHRGLLVGALLALAVEAGGAGLTLDQPRILLLAPPLACASWLVFASEELSGNPQWYTIPIGAALLTLVDIVRWDRRRAGTRMSTPELIGFEAIGAVFLVAASLWQAATRSPVLGLVAVGASISLMAWGATTRVRRRLVGGAALLPLTVVVMIAAPIARHLPEFRGVTLWLSLAAVGSVFILIAAFLEWGRTRVRSAVRRLGELMEGWE